MAGHEYRDIVDLFEHGASAEAEEKFLSLRERNREQLQRRQRDLTGKTEAAAKLQWDGTAYYLAENGRKTGLYCRRCYDMEGTLVKLQAQDSTSYLCRVCRTKYERQLCG